MRIQLKRKPRHLPAVAGAIVVMAGLVFLFTGAILPNFSLMWLGVRTIEVGVVLIVINVFVSSLLRIVPQWRRRGGQYIEVNFAFDSPLRCGEQFNWEIGFVPLRPMAIKQWSVTLVGVRQGQEMKPLSRDLILALTCTLMPNGHFPKGKPVVLQSTLFVPGNAQPSSETEGHEITWLMEVSARSSALGTFTGRVPVVVVPPLSRS